MMAEAQAGLGKLVGLSGGPEDRTMNYGRQVLLGSDAQRAAYTGGLVTPDVDTRGGSFGPQGYGGGIFDGTSALGNVGDYGGAVGESDCNLTSRSEITRRLQEYLGVRQTGFIDADTCAAWDDQLPHVAGRLNLANVLDTLGIPRSRCPRGMTAYAVPDCGSMVEEAAPEPPPPPPKKQLGTGAKVALGVGALAVLGTGVYFASRK